ncbi:MAG: iron-containing alcohol dehydrogenase family protein [Ruminococcaceae bacterium]|nr:iron-containing alcohol dehydrogenase family protein [Oscillospiraceae bacterium]
MATKSKVVESSFRLGVGRYIQEDGAALRLADELKLIGCKKPYIVHGKNAIAVAGEKIRKSLADAGMDAVYYEYTEFCNPDLGEKLTKTEEFKSCDCVVAVGGGNVCDVSKLMAALVDYPIITVPTSSATCAPYTPLSVMYNYEGQTIGSRHHVKEVNAVLVDMEILCCQPVRLLVSGIYDSLAKLIETNQRLLCMADEDVDIGLRTSYVLSDFIYKKLLADLPTVVDDTANGRNTKAVYDTVYILIAVTGLISALARGSNQCAIAHKVYETTRFVYPKEAHDKLHGELVGIGLIPQLIYNGEPEAAETFKNQMKALGMPVTLAEAGIPTDPEGLAAFTAKIENSSAMDGTTDEEKAKFREAFKVICK